MEKQLCRARYMPAAYQDIDTSCGNPFNHMGEHKTKNKIPLVLEGTGAVDHAVWSDVIELKSSDEEGVWAECTCHWGFGPSTRVLEVGLEAFTHSANTGHVLRKHPGM